MPAIIGGAAIGLSWWIKVQSAYVIAVLVIYTLVQLLRKKMPVSTVAIFWITAGLVFAAEFLYWYFTMGEMFFRMRSITEGHLQGRDIISAPYFAQENAWRLWFLFPHAYLSTINTASVIYAAVIGSVYFLLQKNRKAMSFILLLLGFTFVFNFIPSSPQQLSPSYFEIRYGLVMIYMSIFIAGAFIIDLLDSTESNPKKGLHVFLGTIALFLIQIYIVIGQGLFMGWKKVQGFGLVSTLPLLITALIYYIASIKNNTKNIKTITAIFTSIFAVLLIGAAISTVIEQRILADKNNYDMKEYRILDVLSSNPEAPIYTDFYTARNLKIFYRFQRDDIYNSYLPESISQPFYCIWCKSNYEETKFNLQNKAPLPPHDSIVRLKNNYTVSAVYASSNIEIYYIDIPEK